MHRSCPTVLWSRQLSKQQSRLVGCDWGRSE